MSDLGKLDIGDWLGLAVVSVGAGMGSAMAWFGKSNTKRDERIDDLEAKVEKYKDLVVAQATSLAVLQACQANINEKLDKLEEIKTDIRDSAVRGARSVNDQLAHMLNEMQKIAAQRRP